MSDNAQSRDEQTTAVTQQTKETTEANKPDGSRAKGKPEAGNILGGVQPK